MKEDFTIPSLIASERSPKDTDLTFQNRNRLKLRLWLLTLREWELHWLCQGANPDIQTEEALMEVELVNEELTSRGLPSVFEYKNSKKPKTTKRSYLKEFQEDPFKETNRFKFHYDAAKPDGYVARTILQKFWKLAYLITRSNAELVEYCYQRSDYDYWFQQQIEGEMNRRGLSKLAVDDLKKDKVPVALLTSLLSRGRDFALYDAVIYTGATILLFGIPGIYVGYYIYSKHVIVHSLKVHKFKRWARWCGLLLAILGLIIFYQSIEFTGWFLKD